MMNRSETSTYSQMAFVSVVMTAISRLTLPLFARSGKYACMYFLGLCMIILCMCVVRLFSPCPGKGS